MATLSRHTLRSSAAILLTLCATEGSLAQSPQPPEDLAAYAATRQNDLRLSVYVIAHTVRDDLANPDGRREALSMMRSLGIRHAILEVYRGGLLVEEKDLAAARDFLRAAGIDVSVGIATVPGPGFGVHQKGPLGWFDWEAPKTRSDVERAVRRGAALFDEFVVDDFLCTGDLGPEAVAARGGRSWGDYRRDLMRRIAQETIIRPAREVRPNIRIVLKYPQWYDRFHEFGYDVESGPQLFDRIWVGTETRGSYTQRYGFVQPYEGFVNFRWIHTFAGPKMASAWFDHGDCDPNDFVEQAYQTVLAGAKQIVIFNYIDIAQGHGGHHFLRRDFRRLADLAATVAKHPVTGVAAYKPAQSDAGDDLYLMDFVGMLGIPLVPVSKFPTDAKIVFLPSQAAADPGLFPAVEAALRRGTTVVATAGCLARARDGSRLAALAGLASAPTLRPGRAAAVDVDGSPVSVQGGLDVAGDVALGDGAKAVLSVSVDGKTVPFLTSRDIPNGGRFLVLNTRTYSQADFDAVGEVLLAPRALGLLELPRSWANAIRQAFVARLGWALDAPPRVAIQPLGTESLVVHNYLKDKVTVQLTGGLAGTGPLVDRLTGQTIRIETGRAVLDMPARSRAWLGR